MTGGKDKCSVDKNRCIGLLASETNMYKTDLLVFLPKPAPLPSLHLS